MNYIISFGIPYIAALIFTPIMIMLAKKLNIVDKPNARKVHANSIPLLGGIAIFLAYFVSYGILVVFTDNVATNIGYGILFGGMVMVVTGLIDDIYDLKPIYKVMGQIVASFLAMHFGLIIEKITIPMMEEPIYLGWLGIPLTIFWILAITNAVNLIDGLDGLASGVSGIAVLSMFLVALFAGDSYLAVTALVVLGSIMGFLHYNFNPAKIFMGDTGSLFLGFALACLSLLELKEVTFISLLMPVLILSVPISDTVFAILRRKIKGVSVASADKNHLHHQLLKMGMSQRKAVLVIYVISGLFGILSVFIYSSALWVPIIIFIFYILFFYIFAEWIGLLGDGFHPILNILCKFIKANKGRSSDTH